MEAGRRTRGRPPCRRGHCPSGHVDAARSPFDGEGHATARRGRCRADAATGGGLEPADTATGGVDRTGRIFPVIKIISREGIKTLPDKQIAARFKTTVA